MLRYLVAICVLATCATASAGEVQKPGHGHPAQQVTWDQLKQGCANPAQFADQLALKQITIACTDVETDYVADKAGVLPAEVTQLTQVAINTKDGAYQTGPIAGSTPVKSMKDLSCARYKQVETTYTIERSVGCDEIVAAATAQTLCDTVLHGKGDQHHHKPILPKNAQVKELKEVELCAVK